MGPSLSANILIKDPYVTRFTAEIIVILASREFSSRLIASQAFSGYLAPENPDARRQDSLIELVAAASDRSVE